MNRKPTVTIGIPAHNEEKNLPRLLRSLSEQRGQFFLERVIVACDGCTDGTAVAALAFTGNLPIQVVDDGRRVGQSARMREMMELSQSDVYVSLDADTWLDASDTLETLVAPFADTQIGLVAGGDRPAFPRTFFGHIAVTVVDQWRYARAACNGGDTVHNSHGCVLALSHRLAQAAKLPPTINGADHFLYFKAKEMGLGFRYQESAIVRYREPDNLSDYLIQRSRFHTIHDSMEAYFGVWVREAYVPLPGSVKRAALRRMFTERPFFCVLAIALELISRLYIFFKHPMAVGGIWQTVKSTK